MNVLITFLFILAWFAAVVYTIGFIFTFINDFNYEGSNLKSRDTLRGIRRTFPVKRRFLIALVAWAFIIAHHVAR